MPHGVYPRIDALPISCRNSHLAQVVNPSPQVLSMLSTNVHSRIGAYRCASVYDNEDMGAWSNRVYPCIHEWSYFDYQSGLLLDFPLQAPLWRFA